MISFSKKQLTYINIAFSLLCLLLLMPSLFYTTPGHGLDPSWVIAMHWTVEKEMIFGQDFIFTFGPLGTLSTRLPFGIKTWQILIYDLYIFGNIFILVYLVVKNYSNWQTYFILLIISIIIYDSYSYTHTFFLLFVLIFWIFYYLEKQNNWIIANLITLFSIIFFIKVSIGIVSLLIFFYFLAFSLFTKKLKLSLFFICLISYVFLVSMIAIFFSVDLINYTYSSLHLINAYNDAMFIIETNFYNYYLSFIIWSSIILLAFYSLFIYFKQNNKIAWEDAFIYSLLILSTYVLLKQSSTRVNTLLFFQFISAFVALLLIFSSFKHNFLYNFFFTVLLISSIYLLPKRNLHQLNTENYFYIKSNNVINYFTGIIYPNNEESLTQDWREDIYKLIGQETVDVFPDAISHLRVKKLNYHPRPIIQSYSVYDAYLINKNFEFYESEKAPKYVVYASYGIDNRYAFHDEVKTLITLLKRYKVIEKDGNQIILERKKTPSPLKITKNPIETIIFNQDYVLPKQDDLLFMRIKTKYSKYGKLRRLLFQPPPLYIVYKLENGEELRFRAIKTILEAGVIINIHIPNINAENLAKNPPNNVDDIITLFNQKGKKNQKVVSFRLETEKGFGYDIFGFNHQITLESFNYQIEEEKKLFIYNDNSKIINIKLPKQSEDDIFTCFKIIQDEEKIFIDNGWAFLKDYDTKKSKVYLVLYSKDKHYIIDSKQKLRVDVADVYKSEKYRFSGFSLSLEKDKIDTGKYQMGILIKNGTRTSMFLSKEVIDISENNTITQEYCFLER